MLRTLTYSSLLFILWALFARWYYTCYIKGCDCCQSTAIDSRLGSLRLSKDGTADILTGYDQFVFGTDSEKPTLNANNEKFLQNVATYLKANGEEKLTVICCHRNTEQASIAVARSEHIRDLIVSYGANPEQIRTSTCKDNDKLLTPAYFALTGKANAPIVPAADGTVSIENTIFNMNISDENFDFNSANFKPGNDFLQKAKELKTYIDDHPDISLSIIGHTDDKGSDSYNMKLGQRRANAVKAHLKGMGIKVKIATSSKGESTPVASNTTDLGRAQNRRVNCKIIP